MRIIRHHEPWNLLTQWQKDLDRLSRGGSLPDNDEETNVATSAWTPAVDIREEETRFVIYADIPGVDPKDIEITMEQGVLTLRGERPLEEENERKLYKRVERVRGTFYRRFGLPDTADAEKITASGKHGVLEVSIPKRAIAQPRKIEVHS